MSLYITSLNSGSNGNCYYIGNDTEAVLIDAGISCRETERRMKILGLSMKLVKAIFVSHEHTDHIKGIPVIAERFSLPVYITGATLSGCCDIAPERTKKLIAYQPVQIGGLSITAFPKFHDAEDPHSFIITCNDITIGVFTDIGAPCAHVTKHFNQCHAAFLETNYDEGLLENGRYPYFLKNRIRGGRGHLSNTQALEIFIRHRPSFMSHLLLSHLSKDNNCPAKAKELFDLHAGSTEVIVASRYEQTPVYTINHSQTEAMVTIPVTALRPRQMSLF
jgi:phosphoribosyl 1,2-cyclic phosphodiesterase